MIQTLLYKQYQRMNTAHKRIYVKKYKRPQRSSFASDPISNGIRASILQKVDNIYQHIQALNNQNNVVKAFIPSPAQISIPIPKTGNITQRRSWSSSSSMAKTSYFMSSRKTSNYSPNSTNNNHINCNNKTKTSQSWTSTANLTAITGRGSDFQQICRRKNWKQPANQQQIRQMMRKKSHMKEQEDRYLETNPYYKIMKRRVKTINDKQDKQVQDCTEEINNTMKVKTQVIVGQTIDDQSQELMRSQFTVQEDKKTKISLQEQWQSRGIRQKSNTKIYEQIKKYFQQKYGTYKTVAK